MRRRWVALLSVVGLAGFGLPLQSQPPENGKATTQTTNKVDNSKKKNEQGVKTANKLTVKQQPLRQQNQSNANQALTKAKNNQLTKAK